MSVSAVNYTHQRSLFIQRKNRWWHNNIIEYGFSAGPRVIRTTAEKSFHACVHNNDKVCYKQKSTPFCSYYTFTVKDDKTEENTFEILQHSDININI